MPAVYPIYLFFGARRHARADARIPFFPDNQKRSFKESVARPGSAKSLEPRVLPGSAHRQLQQRDTGQQPEVSASCMVYPGCVRVRYITGGM